MDSNQSWPPPPIRENIVTSSQLLEDRKASKYGWLGAGLALAGVLLPTLAFGWWMSFVDDGNIPDEDEWYLGDGRADLHWCQAVITVLELVALAFGVRARQTVIGKIIFLIVAAALFFANKVLPEWYWVS